MFLVIDLSSGQGLPKSRKRIFPQLCASLSPMAPWGEKVHFINRRRVAVDEGKEMGLCLRGREGRVRGVCVCMCVFVLVCMNMYI